MSFRFQKGKSGSNQRNRRSAKVVMVGMPSMRAVRGVSALADSICHSVKHPDLGPFSALLRRGLSSFFVVALLAAGLFGFTTAPGAQNGLTYLIGPGDQLLITVRREPELSTTTTVRPDGRITIPLVEDLPAAGKTPVELADAISERLTQYLNDPMVTVTLASGSGDLSQQIRVLGEAAEPSSIAYRQGITVLDAITSVGGLTQDADGNSAIIVRKSGEDVEQIPLRLDDLLDSGDSSANVALMPGDVIVIPEGFLTGEWTIEYRVNGSQTFSDNIDLEDSDRQFGTITRAGPGFSLQGNTTRVRASVDADIDGVAQFGGDDEGFSVDPSIAGSSTTEISPDFFFFDLNASISRQLLNSRDASSGSGQSTENTDFLVTLSASPYLLHRLGDFADVEWRYRITPVLVDSGDDSDTLSHVASVRLDSGDDFNAFDWTWTNSVGQEVREEDDITTAETDLELTYQLVQSFALIGAIGYEFRDGDENDDNNFDGLTWRTGFSWEPSPNLTAEATYGRRDDEESLDASLSYQISPRTSVRASYSEELETSQGRAASNVAGLGIDPDTGGLDDDFDDDVGPFTFDDETRRVRTLQLSADHSSGRNTFGLSGLVGMSEDGSEGDEDFYRASVSWNRTLSQSLSLSTGASYDRSEFDEDDRTDDTYRANVGLAYSLTSNAQASVSYSFQARDSDQDNDSFVENAVTVGIGVSF